MVRQSSRLLFCFCVLAVGSGTGCQMLSQGHNVEGTRLYKQGQFKQALGSFELAAEQDPKNADAYYNMAATLHQMGLQRKDQSLLTRAEELYNRALDLDGNHTETYRGLAVLLAETGQADRAFKLVQGWAQRSPKNADARIELARLHHEIGQRETAERLLHDSLNLDLKNARAWAALGSLREANGDSSQALQNYEKSVSLNAFQPGLVSRIAQLKSAGGALNVDPGNSRLVDQNWVPRRY